MVLALQDEPQGRRFDAIIHAVPPRMPRASSRRLGRYAALLIPRFRQGTNVQMNGAERQRFLSKAFATITASRTQRRGGA
jgi:hypothetical protein